MNEVYKLHPRLKSSQICAVARAAFLQPPLPSSSLPRKHFLQVAAISQAVKKDSEISNWSMKSLGDCGTSTQLSFFMLQDTTKAFTDQKKLCLHFQQKDQDLTCSRQQDSPGSQGARLKWLGSPCAIPLYQDFDQ